MKSLIEGEFPLQETHRLRYDLPQTLTDSDLAYIQSFKTFKHDWSYRATAPELATSVARLQTWHITLEQEFETVLRGFSEDDLHHKQIDRGHGFTPSLMSSSRFTMRRY